MFEIGATLREARERQGLELTQVERALKIRARHLQALEDERFDWLPGEAYSRSFLRTYADHLGLDWQLYLAEYDSRYRREEEPALLPQRRIRPRRRMRAARPVAVTLTAAVAVVIGLAAWQLGGTKPVATPSEGAGAALQKRPPAAPVVPRRTVTPVVHHAVPKPAAKVKPKAKPPRRVSGEVVFTTKSGPCWILVRRGSEQGPQMYVATLAPGRTVSFRGKRLWLRIGAPSSLRTVVNGRPLRLPAGAPVNLLVTPSGARVL